MAKEENLFDNTAADSGKPSANTEKLKALRAAMDKIEKNFQMRFHLAEPKDFVNLFV